jgi:hypothetical protein
MRDRFWKVTLSGLHSNCESHSGSICTTNDSLLLLVVEIKEGDSVLLDNDMIENDVGIVSLILNISKSFSIASCFPADLKVLNQNHYSLVLRMGRKAFVDNCCYGKSMRGKEHTGKLFAPPPHGSFDTIIRTGSSKLPVGKSNCPVDIPNCSSACIGSNRRCQ